MARIQLAVVSVFCIGLSAAIFDTRVFTTHSTGKFGLEGWPQGQLKSLGRATVRCPLTRTSSSLNKFKLITNNNVAWMRMHYDYRCKKMREGRTGKRRNMESKITAGWSEMAHKMANIPMMKCNPGESLMGFKYRSLGDGSNGFRLHFECVETGVDAGIEHETQCRRLNSVNDLHRFEVACGADEVLTGFGVEECSYASFYKFKYFCASTCTLPKSGNRMIDGHCRCADKHKGDPYMQTCERCGRGTEVSNDYQSCDDINECDDNNGGCDSSTQCEDTRGSWKCKCLEHLVMDDGSLEGGPDEKCKHSLLKYSTSMSNSDMRLNLTGNGQYAKFRVSLSVWNPSKTIDAMLLGFPREFNQELGNNHLVKLYTEMRPGRNYRLKIQAGRTGDWDPKINVDSDVALECGCDATEYASLADRTGAPSDVQVEQSLGYMRLSWKDNSLCETSFSFTRLEVSPNVSRHVSFITDYHHMEDSKECGVQHDPDMARDPVSKLKVGSLYRYCVRAVSALGKMSAGGCGNATVEWEAVVHGRVTLDPRAGTLPVSGVNIGWFIGPKDAAGFESGFQTTDKDGNFRIHIKSSKLEGDEQRLVLIPEKTTGNVTHKFLCPGRVHCIETVVHLEHLSLNHQVDFIDDTGVQFEGRVGIAGTEHDSEGQKITCPLAGVEVCLVDITTGMRFECRPSDRHGIYSIPAVIGTHVRPEGKFFDSDLVPVNATQHEGGYLITESPNQRADFLEITRKNLTVEVAGGKCNRRLGTAKLRFTLPFCPHWLGQTIQTSVVQYTSSVPAHDGEVVLESVKDWNSADLTHVSEYFKRLFGDKKSQKVLLAGAPQQQEQDSATQSNSADGNDLRLVRFEYHPKPELSISFGPRHIDPVRDGNGHITHVLPSQTKATAMIRAVEKFSSGEECDWLDGDIIITNHLGEVEERAEQLRQTDGLSDEQVEGLTVCRQACKKPIVHDDAPTPISIAQCAGWHLVASTWSAFTSAGNEEVPVVDEDVEALGQFNMQDIESTLRLRHSQVLLECGNSTPVGGSERTSTPTTTFRKVVDFSGGEEKSRDTLAESGLVYSGLDMTLSGISCDGDNVTWCEPLRAHVTTYTHEFDETSEAVFAAELSSPRCGGPSAPGTWARVWVRANEKSPSKADLPSECTGARLRVQREEHTAVPKNARVDLQLFTGSPETNAAVVKHEHPHTKLFKAHMTGAFQGRAEVEAFVVVTGHKLRSSMYSVPVPEYKPFVVLRDPPGGNSFAEYNQVKTTIDIDVSSYEAYNGWLMENSFANHITRDTQLGTGAFVGVWCTTMGSKISDLEIGPVLRAHREDMFREQLDAKTTTATYEFVWSYSTNPSPTVTGKMADMFLTPALNVVYSNVTVISWNATSGKASSDHRLMFSLQSDKNRPAFTWQSYASILNREIPNLEELLRHTDNETEEDKIREGIEGWNRTLADHDRTLEAAERGELRRVKNLVPRSFIDSAKKTNGEAASEKEHIALQNVNTIKFEGAGGTLSFLMRNTTIAETRKQGEGSNSMHDMSVGGGTHAHLAYGFVSQTVDMDNRLHRTASSVSEKAKADQDQSSSGFTLADPDVGDYFDVDVFMDNVYKTFVFVTRGGASKCPFEEATEAREKPGIRVVDSPLGPVLPGNPAIFEIKLENHNHLEASSFEFFAEFADNTGGARLLVDGAPFSAARLYEDVPADGAATAFVEIFRGPEEYEYAPINVGFRSLCDSTRTETVPLHFSFVEPCPAVEFAGDLATDGSFLVNVATERKSSHPGELKVVARNPEVVNGNWTSVQRLESVRLEYRPAGTLAWMRAVDSERRDIDAAQLETSFGFSTVWWNPRDLPDGGYDLRLRAVCGSASDGNSNPPPGLDESVSGIIVGHIDRAPPAAFGQAEPSGRDVMPGDDVSVSFLEPLECDEPHRFGVRLSITGTDVHLDNRNLRVLCESRKISIALPPWLPFEEVMGKTAELTVWDAEDLHRNILDVPIQHDFRFGMVSLGDAKVEISRLALSVPFSPGMSDVESPSFAEFAAALARDVASVADADISRIVVDTIAANATDNTVQVALTLTAGSQPPASKIASELQSAIRLIHSLNSLDHGDDEVQRRRLQTARFQILHKAKSQNLQRALENIPSKPLGHIEAGLGFWKSVSLERMALGLVLLLLLFQQRGQRSLEQVVRRQMKRQDLEMVEAKFDQEMGQFRDEGQFKPRPPVCGAQQVLEMSQDVHSADVSTESDHMPPSWRQSAGESFLV